jgi:phage terminase large subunit-like protein
MKARSKAEIVAALSAEQRKQFSEKLRSAGGVEHLKFLWGFWARPSQFPPPGDWSNWLILAGRGLGKTRMGAEWVRMNMCGPTPLSRGRWRHIALIAETAADARDVMVGDGKAASDPRAGSGLLQIHPKDFRPTYEPSKRRLTWPNGAVASIYNGTEPDQLRGPQHDAAWCDELAKWRYAQDAWDQLQFGLRTGTNPQVCITTTPRPIGLLKQIMADPGTVVTSGSTFENQGNLSRKFLATVKRKYEGTRLGRQELHAELLEDIEGALWKRAVIDALRVKERDLPPLKRVVVAIDPNASSTEDSNECGIICAGLGDDDHGYILDDVSGVKAPDHWARAAISLLHARRGDRIVAEINNGGDMVENTLRTIDPSVPYRSVWASRGKVVRAEPVSALYEQCRVHHVGPFPRLENQMCAFTVDFNRNEMGYSPDRVDALVWALTELMIDGPSERRFCLHRANSAGVFVW